jgi:hypothetical protein
MKKSNTKALLFIVSVSSAAAFSDPLSKSTTFIRYRGKLNSYAPSQQEYESNYLLDDFRTANGEIVNPYEILNVNRAANRMDVKKNYRTLSKLYHPDGVRFADSLPKNW